MVSIDKGINPGNYDIYWQCLIKYNGVLLEMMWLNKTGDYR